MNKHNTTCDKQIEMIKAINDVLERNLKSNNQTKRSEYIKASVAKAAPIIGATIIQILTENG